MREQELVKNSLIKNMILNLITFTVIFSILGIIIYTQVTSSLYKSSDEELVNNKNRVAIIADMPSDVKEKLDTEEMPQIKEFNNDIDEQTRIRKENNAPNPRLIYLFRDESGTILKEHGNYNNEYFENANFDLDIIDEIYSIKINNEYEYRGINYKIENDGVTSYVQVLINVDAERTIIQDFTTTLIILIIVCIILAIIASYVLSKKTLAPIISSWKKQTEFVQNASHELRTPLTIIQAKEELLLEEPNKRIIDKVEDINTVLNETRRLSKLIKDLMDLARADSNKMELKKEKIDIDKLIEKAVEPFCEIAITQNKKFALDLNYNKEISIDRNKIHQLLIILLDNAIKYTSEKESIKVATFEKEGKLVLEVLDTGIGISDEGLKHIFDRFYREDKARTREKGGSGLGLSIAHIIVDGHGGSIKVKHNVPKGTIVEIKIK